MSARVHHRRRIICVCDGGISTLEPVTLQPTNAWAFAAEFGGVQLGGAVKARMSHRPRAPASAAAPPRAVAACSAG